MAHLLENSLKKLREKSNHAIERNLTSSVHWQTRGEHFQRLGKAGFLRIG